MFIKKGLIITASLFCLFFFAPKVNAAIVLDNLTGSTLDDANLYCQNLYDGGWLPSIYNDLICVIRKQGFGYSTSTKPFVSKGKLKSITLNIFMTPYYSYLLTDSDHVTLRVDDTFGSHYGISDLTVGEILSFGHRYTKVKFAFSPEDTIDFSTTTIRTLYTTGGNGNFIAAETGTDTIKPSTYPDGNAVYHYCSIVSCSWYEPISPPDVNRDIMMIIETTDTEPPPPQGKTPVLIVPGILGSELYNGDELLWADLGRMFTDVNDNFLIDNLSLDASGHSIKELKVGDSIKYQKVLKYELDIFKGLMQSLSDNGYQPDQSLFFFPYDWRLDLEKTKDKLYQTIEAIKSETGSLKVDIVAHSMGGLLTKSYLNAYGNSSVNKLIFVGTPHLGAPKAAKVILEGDRFNIPWLDPDAMKEVAKNSPAVYELLPDQQYFNNYQGYFKKYKFLKGYYFLDYQQTKDYFSTEQNKNSALLADAETFKNNLSSTNFSGIDVYNIAGCKTSTQAAYQLAFDNSTIGRVAYISGDGTVPFPSADGLNITPQNKYYVKDADHAGLPSMDGVREIILGILNNQPNPQGKVSNSSSFCNFKGKSLSWRSPVEVHIYSNGKHTGPIENNGIEYGISGVDYEIIGHNKFIFLPTDEGQNYRVEAKGLENGSFDLIVQDYNNSQAQEAHIFNDVAITPNSSIKAEINESSSDNTIQLDNLGSGIFGNIQESAYLTGHAMQDSTPPSTTLNTHTPANANGWFNNNVWVSLSAEDPLIQGNESETSDVLNIKYSLDNGAYQDYSSSTPINITDEGIHSIKFYSTDRAGNNEEVKERQIKIDKTPPEFSVYFDFNKKDFIFIGLDNLSAPADVKQTASASKIQFMDLAGNATELALKEKDRKKSLPGELLSLSYNGQQADMSQNRLSFVWVYGKRGPLKSLNQQILSKNEFRVFLSFDGKNTKVLSWGKGSKPETNIYSGLKIISIKSQNGKLIWEVK